MTIWIETDCEEIERSITKPTKIGWYAIIMDQGCCFPEYWEGDKWKDVPHEILFYFSEEAFNTKEEADAWGSKNYRYRKTKVKRFEWKD